MNGASSSTSLSHRGMLSRLRHTPLRDLIRGRLSGRLDYRGLVAASGLPEPVSNTIIDVVRRTRLWRLEKGDVAAELIAHFTDGLDAGESGEQLVGAFGDPRAAARLIRRAKKRQRPVTWHAIRYAGLTLAAIVLIYSLSILYYFTGRPSVTTDYRQILNAEALAVPEDERAWPLYREALLGLQGHTELVQAFNRYPRPGEDGWDEAVAFVERNREVIALVRQAAQRPGLGFPVGYGLDDEDLALWPEESPEGDEMIITASLPHLAELRKLAKILMLDAQRAAADGNGATVVADLRAVLGMAGHAREAPFIICDLVSLALVNLGVQSLGGILAEEPKALTQDQLRDLAHQMASTDDLLRIRVEGERMMFKDLVQRIYTDDGVGDGRITDEGMRLFLGSLASGSGGTTPNGLPADWLLALPIIDFIASSRRETLAEVDQLLATFQAEAARPLWEAEASEADRQITEWKSTVMGTLSHPLPVLLMPALQKVYVHEERTIAQRDAVLAAIALVIHRHRHGGWPESLEALTPDLLPEVPPDRFDGQPLRYTIVDDQPRLYSLGTDRDDDGGRPVEWLKNGVPDYDAAARWVSREHLREMAEQPDASRGFNPVPDADWVLWPREIEPLRRTPDLPCR